MKTIIVFEATGNQRALLAVHLIEQGYKDIAVGLRKGYNDLFGQL
jgi:hypothetical protein